MKKLLAFALTWVLIYTSGFIYISFKKFNYAGYKHDKQKEKLIEKKKGSTNPLLKKKTDHQQTQQ